MIEFRSERAKNVVIMPGDEEIGLKRIRRFTGNYFVVIGWLGVVSLVLSLATYYWTDYVHIDLSFILWFWIGRCLREGSSTARKWAIAFFVMVSAFVFLTFVVPGATAHVGSRRFERTDPEFVIIAGLIWIIFAIPGIILLGKRGKAAFAGGRGINIEH
ncbi:hypothetical protein V2O64_12950 [Verrucomicrobiaceae bacterium 227]